jgi:DNA-binding transcriptional ArsR family regulator
VTHDPSTLAAPTVIRGLSGPVRQEIVDAISSRGPISIARLARALGRSQSSLYFHIAKLEELGLVLRKGLQPSNPTALPMYRERKSVLYDVPQRWIKVCYEPDQRETRKPIEKLVTSMAAMAARNFASAYQPGAIVSGPNRQLWAARSKRFLSARELREVNRHLDAVARLFDHRDGGRAGPLHLVEVTVILAPAPVKPRRRRRSRPTLPPPAVDAQPAASVAAAAGQARSD